MRHLNLNRLSMTIRLASKLTVLLIVLVLVFGPHPPERCGTDASTQGSDPCQRSLNQRVALSHAGCQCTALPSPVPLVQIILPLVTTLPGIRPRFAAAVLRTIDPPPRP